MRVVVIGGTGHTGTYLVPRLVEAGHQVAVISRQKRRRYQADESTGQAAWEHVEWVEMDRAKLEATGEFGMNVAAMNPDVVIDMICYHPESAKQLVDALCGRVQLLIHCGTIWASGASLCAPSTEDEPRRPICDYGRRKAAIEEYLLDKARRSGFPVTILRPGHMVGRGWSPVNPAANFNPQVYSKLAKGQELSLPNLGLETLHHVHADDVAQAFMQALSNWNGAKGEVFNVTSASALTLRGYAEAIAGWFGKPAKLAFLPWDEWKKTVSEEDAASTWDHISHSSCCSIEKARRMLGYQPRYTSLEAIKESLTWLIQNGAIEV
ncbi:MAG: NAD(P)-dependent oxidoreductase [Acidobacteria bacterium]|nr:MAG: NAD(P)-dependent oxidoreductase [Acidobacteriota bacterium]